MKVPVTDQTPSFETRFVLLDYGFRLYFLGAAVWALFDMGIWTGFYTFHWSGIIPPTFSSPMSWHAHEMIYGYGMAVVAGFLLTAVVNWTGQKTVTGYRLILLFLCWFLARVLPLQGSLVAFAIGRCFDLGFLFTLACVSIRPCLRRGQKMNSLLIAIHLSLMIAGSVLYALGATSLVAGGDRIGLYLGLFILVLLTLVMGRRVIPFFIESAAPGNLKVRNYVWVDRMVPVLIALYIVCELFGSQRYATIAALSAAIVLSVRLAGWYTGFIWKRPLLWVLYIAYGWFVVAFALRAASAWYSLNPFLAVHALTVGGIGTITLGMMARVSLGHSGRSIAQPPRSVGVMFICITSASILRVLIPVVVPAQYINCIAASQVLWMIAFGLFLAVYAPILTTQMVQPRSIL